MRRLLSHSMVRYLFIGGTCFVVDFSIFSLLTKLCGFHYLWVNLVSFTVATVVNYLLCVGFVFRSGCRHGRAREFLLLVMVSCGGLALNQLCLYIFVDVCSIDVLVAKVSTVVLTYFVNYYGRSIFVFGGKRD